MAYDLKKEEDVKEFLENLGIEYRFQCYREKEPDGCHRLGDFLEAVKKDFHKACKIYKFNCDDYKYGKSCFKYGNYSFLGKGCKADLDRAFEYYSIGCENASPESCLHAGLMLTSTNRDEKKPWKKDYVKGLDFLDKGCQGNNGMSCYFASGIYITGAPNVLKNMEKAFEYTRKACELDNIHACANLSQMYRKGDGVKKDTSLAQKYKDKAVEMQEQITKGFRQIEFEQGT